VGFWAGFAVATIGFDEALRLGFKADGEQMKALPMLVGRKHSIRRVPAVAPAMLDFACDEHVNVGWLGVQDGLRVIYVESALGEPTSGSERLGYSVRRREKLEPVDRVAA
jgi:hypothetical protein